MPEQGRSGQAYSGCPRVCSLDGTMKETIGLIEEAPKTGAQFIVFLWQDAFLIILLAFFHLCVFFSGQTQIKQRIIQGQFKIGKYIHVVDVCIIRRAIRVEIFMHISV